jgi:hypothetical protein
MVLELDTLKQRELWDETGGTRIAEILAGPLRLAFLYGERLVVPDTQIFDGVAMLALGPRGVAELLGSVHRTDIVVTMREASAAAALKKMLTRDFDSSLTGVGWSSTEIRDRRAEWVRAIDRGRVGSTTWPPFPFGAELATRLKVRVPDHPAARRHLTTVRRSDVSVDLLAAELDEAVRREIFDWWDGAYMDVLAQQHGTTWLTTLSPQAAFTPKSAMPARTHPIPEVIVGQLSRISGPEFATLRADADRVLHSLRTRDRWIDRFRLNLVVLDAGRSPRPVLEFVAMAARLATFGLLILDALTGNGFLRMPLPVAIVLAVALILLQIPVIDVVKFFRLFSPVSRAIRRTPGRGRA